VCDNVLNSLVVNMSLFFLQVWSLIFLQVWKSFMSMQHFCNLLQTTVFYFCVSVCVGTQELRILLPFQLWK